MSTSFVKGVTASGDIIPLLLNEDGSLPITGNNGNSNGGSGSSNNTPLITEPPLIASGYTPVRSVENCDRYTYQINVSNIGTNIKVRVEGNLIGEDFSNLNESNQDTIITENGCHLFCFDAPIARIRFVLVSISGGNPTVQVYLKRG